MEDSILSIPKNLIEWLKEEFNKFVEGLPICRHLFVTAALFLALAHFLPDLNTTLKYRLWPLDVWSTNPGGWLRHWRGLPPKTILTYAGLVAATLSVLLVILYDVTKFLLGSGKLILDARGKLCNRIRKLRLERRREVLPVADFLEALLKNLHLTRWSLLRRVVRWVSELSAAFKTAASTKVYRLEEITLSSAGPHGRNPGREYALPITVDNLKSMTFNVEILECWENHWRAGVEFNPSIGSHPHLIYHAYENRADPGLLQARTHLQLDEVTSRDQRQQIPEATNTRVFGIKIERSGAGFKFYVNDVLKSTITIPAAEKLTRKVTLKAWADGGLFKVKFKNVKVVWS